MSKYFIFFGLLCLSLTASPYLSAQDTTEEDSEDAIEAVAEEVVEEVVEQEEPSPVVDQPSEQFVPSEDIIADSSISFPSDI